MFESIKIGYVPYNADLSHTDDRRRFPYFAQRKNVAYEVANTAHSYDVIILPAPCNLTKWLLYKKKHPQTKFIFEMVDSLTYQKDLVNLLFKGTGRFLLGKEDRPSLNHRNLLIKWIRLADVVICSNPKIKSEILQWNKNVVLSLDYLEHEFTFLKNDFSIKGKMKLLWEGQSVVLPALVAYKDLFRKVNDFCELHVITSDEYPRLGPLLKRSSKSLLQELPIDTVFHSWDLQHNAAIFAQSDCGIIPLRRNDLYGWHKPANKLISYWFSGIPTLASNTPAYCDVAAKTENNFICDSIEKWIERITHIRSMTPGEREQEAKSKFEFAKKLFSNEVHDHFWMDLLGEMSARVSAV
jgi:hypothetical protein